MPRTAQSPARYFWSRVEKRAAHECWPWKGAVGNGYGIASLKTGRVRATRLAWMVANDREWPEGKIACHSCDNPICVNPDHIWVGTHLENMRDCRRKGRHPHWAKADATPRPIVVGPKVRRKPPKRERVLTEYCVTCGHHRTDDYIERNGLRRCRECNRVRSRARFLRRKAAEAAKRAHPKSDQQK